MLPLPEFDSPRLLVARAREHIGELDKGIKAFFQSRPYTRVVDLDHESRQEVHKIRLTAKLPSRFSAIAKDAVSNLRDVLDHSVYASAVALGVIDPEKTMFPFANDAVHLQGEINSWKLEDVPAEIKPLLATFQPYPAGNKLLCGLNKLRNPNTHRMIVPVGFVTLGNNISVSSGTVMGPSQIGYSKWLPATNEVEFMRLGFGSKMDYGVYASFDVAFGDVEIVKDQPVVGTLNAMIGEVERITSDIEANVKRIRAARGGSDAIHTS